MDFYLDPPTISFDPANHNQLILTITGRGGLTIEFPPALPETRPVQFQIVALVQPRFAVSPGALNFAPNPDDVTVSDWSFSIIAGLPFSPNANAYLTDAVFRSRLEATLSQGLTSGFLKIPPIRFGALGPAFDVASTSSVSRVADDSVLIGLNLQNSSVSIVGQIQEVPSFAGSHDIAVALNPAVLPVIFADALAEMKTIIQEQGATGDPPTITTGDQKISVAGSASNDFGSVNFSFDAVVALTAFRGGKLFQYIGRPVSVKTKIWPAINFLIQNIKVDVDPALWVRAVEVGGIFLFGSVAPLVIEDLLNSVSNQVTSAVQSAPVTSSIPRVQHLPPMKEGDPSVKLRINDFSIHSDAIFVGIDVTPQLPTPMLMGLTTIPINYLSRPIRYRLITPLEIVDDDPFLRIHWRVQDLNSGQLVLDQDGSASGRFVQDITVSDFGPNVLPLGISADLYRKVGTQITPLLSEGVRLDTSSALLPGSLTRWRYQVKNPQVKFSDADQDWKYLGDSTIQRWSAVHRLDKPCKYAKETIQVRDIGAVAGFSVPLNRDRRP